MMGFVVISSFQIILKLEEADRRWGTFAVEGKSFVDFLKKMLREVPGLKEDNDLDQLEIPITTWDTDRGSAEIRLEEPDQFKFGPSILVLQIMND
jgi:hypothetical protein